MCGREWPEPSSCLQTLLCCQDGPDPHCACWCVEENDPSHLAAFRPYSAVRMDLILTVLADVWKRMTRAILLPSDPTLLSGWTWSSLCLLMCGREWPEPSCCLQTLLCCQDGPDPHCACWCVEENDPSHLAAFRPYSAVRMDLILTVLADVWKRINPSHLAAFRPYSAVRMDLILTVLADVWKRMTRAILLPSDPTLLSGWTWSSLCLLMGFFTTIGPGVLSCVSMLDIISRSFRLYMVDHFDLISVFFSLRLSYCQWELLKLFLTTACSEPYTCIPVSVCLTSFQGHLGSDPTHVPTHPALAEARVKVP